MSDPILTFGAMSMFPNVALAGHDLWDDPAFDILVAMCPKTQRRQRCNKYWPGWWICSGCEEEIRYTRVD